MWTPKEIQAAFALTIAALLSVWAMLLPPQGDIKENMLILIAQFLVFAATLLGVGGSIERILRRFKKLFQRMQRERGSRNATPSLVNLLIC